LFQGSEATPSVGIADRARHPDELKQDSGNWLIDIDYYISQQVLLDHLLSAHS
jgi:DNA polymerase alpha subunit A